jgi:hypothetical protein
MKACAFSRRALTADAMVARTEDVYRSVLAARCV